MTARFLAALTAVLFAACGPGGPAAVPSPPLPPAGVVLISQETLDGPRVRLIETVSRRAYRVEGTTAQELRVALNAAGPIANYHSARFDGLTDWSFQWSFRYERSAGCSIARATIEFDVVVILPELARPDLVPPELLARWQTYLAALETHELGHVERQLTIARDLLAAFEASPAASACGELGHALNALGEVHIQKVRSADLAYDIETGHGATQGAVFP